MPPRKQIPRDWFLAGLGLAVLLAWIFPAPGARGGWLHPAVLNKAGVSLVFFLHGLSLSFSALRSGTQRWKLHLVVQSCTYLLFPLLGLGVVALGGDRAPPGLALGLLYLCAIPSTVSSSVAMTAAARGNVPAAVFNATLSSVLGVLLTPLWVGLFLKTGGHPLPVGKVVLDLSLWLLLPLALGQAARPWLAAFAHRRQKWIHAADRGTILMLVYTSFCDSVQRGVWPGAGWRAPLVTLAASAALFFAVMFLAGALCDALDFPEEDRIAAVFCGSKKSIAAGVPMAQVIFGADPRLGLILLPIMIYHPMQLFICAGLAARWAARPERG